MLMSQRTSEYIIIALVAVITAGNANAIALMLTGEARKVDIRIEAHQQLQADILRLYELNVGAPL